MEQRPQTEAELVDALLRGDEEAFRTIVSKHYGSMTRVARGLLGSDALAAEVVQETWAAVLRGLPRFRRESSLKTWIYQILINRARRVFRQEQRTINFSALGPADDSDDLSEQFAADGHWASPVHGWYYLNPESDAASREGVRLLAAELEKLPENQRVVVTLHDIEGLSSEDICAVLDITPANQRVLLHRGRTRLRRALEAAETNVKAKSGT